MKILKQSKYLRYLFGYPINSGHCLVSILPSTRPPTSLSPSPSPSPSSYHPFLGYKSYHQIYEMNLGSLSSSSSSSSSHTLSSRSSSFSPSITPLITTASTTTRATTRRALATVNIKYLPCSLHKGFHHFQHQLQKLFLLKKKLLQKGNLFYLKKQFNLFRKNILLKRKLKLFYLQIQFKYLKRWKYKFIFYRQQKNKLRKIWNFMKRFYSSKLLLRSWYLKSAYFPLLRKGFNQIKLYSKYSFQRDTHINSRQAYWKLKLYFFEWKQFYKIQKWFEMKLLKKYFYLIFKFYFLIFKKSKKIKLKYLFLKFQKRIQKSFHQFQLIQKYNLDFFIKKIYFKKMFQCCLCDKRKLINQKNKINFWFNQKKLKNSFDQFLFFLKQKKFILLRNQQKYLKFILWKFYKKIKYLKLQKVYLKITRSYYFINFQRRYLKRWMRYAKRRNIRRKKNQLGKKYFSFQKQLFVVSLLKNLAKC
jgi:hypothetical protein